MKTKVIHLYEFHRDGMKWVSGAGEPLEYIIGSDFLRVIVNTDYCGIVRLNDDTLQLEMRKGRSHITYSVTKFLNSTIDSKYL